MNIEFHCWQLFIVIIRKYVDGTLAIAEIGKL